MIRVVRRPEGSLAVDRSGPGRGAWLCQDSAECLAAAIQRRAFERAFKAPVETGAAEALRARLEGAEEHPTPDVRG